MAAKTKTKPINKKNRIPNTASSVLKLLETIRSFSLVVHYILELRFKGLKAINLGLGSLASLFPEFSWKTRLRTSG